MDNLKKVFVYSLITSFVLSAIFAVVTVLIGSFTQFTQRVFMTFGMAMFHACISLLYIHLTDTKQTLKNLKVFMHFLLFIIMASFLTSIFGIWDLISSSLVLKLFSSYTIVTFAVFHGDLLSKTLNKENYIDVCVYLNYLFMSVVVTMFMVLIFLEDTLELSNMFFRIFVAMGIIDATLTILVMALYFLYVKAHPDLSDPLTTLPNQQDNNSKRGASIWVILFLVLLFFKFVSLLISLTTSF